MILSPKNDPCRSFRGRERATAGPPGRSPTSRVARRELTGEPRGPNPSQLILGYLACNFIAYTAIFRLIPFFRTETGILLAHVVSFGVLVSLVTAQAIMGADGLQFDLPRVALAFSLHGIYSLSFLELWSLTQGSYSLSILELVAGARHPVSLQAIEPLCAIGPVKRSSRNAALVSLRLLRETGDGKTRLTAAGYFCATGIRWLLWFSGGRGLNR